MNDKTYFTVVVPLDHTARKMAGDARLRQPLRPMIWSQAAEQIKPLLGKTCSSFSPAADPFGEPMGLPFGVALGAAEPQLFLLCYLHARKQQEKEIEARNSKIRARGMTVGHFQPDQDTEVTVMAYHAADPELQSFVETARRFFTNDITAAAGLYYQGFNSNYISRKQEEQIFSNLNAYALCVAELQPVEGEA